MWKLIHYMRLQKVGCPVGRHELSDTEWLWLGAMKQIEKGHN